MQTAGEDLLKPPSEGFWTSLKDRSIFSPHAAAVRLWHVAEGIEKSGISKVPDAVKARAYRSLVSLLRHYSRDGHGYLKAVKQYNQLAPSVGGQALKADEGWARHVIQSNDEIMGQLEQELRHSTVGQVKESCRLAMERIIRQAANAHDFPLALQWYTCGQGSGRQGLQGVSYRDRCSTPSQYAEMYINMCELAVLVGKASDVHLFAAKVSQILSDTPTVPNAASIKAAVSCLQGFCSASNGAYSTAATTLTKVNMQDVPPAASSVLSGTLGGLFSIGTACGTAVLCRIASANSRAQLKEGIACDADAAVQMSNSTSGLLRVLCEYPRLQELVDSVVDCRYAECLTLIDELVNDLAYDPLIGHRAHAIGRCARMRCLITHCNAFREVPLLRIAHDLGYSSVEALEPDLEAAIQGRILLPGGGEEKLFARVEGRIDLQAGVLRAVEVDSRERMQEMVEVVCGPTGFAANIQKVVLEFNLRQAAAKRCTSDKPIEDDRTRALRLRLGVVMESRLM
ncbi:hypothetical protein Pmar_PMAR003659 [Perkinsus marinus ATCC 50983]|uniref:PCI domain-containing protein n=1 Tax=Perkinsus marinus (strain ATCC 50983 / TXsc) TaxID=423536 RepID=C5KHY4_PERM5|nr:hypothetical protein Pmar_PMAR003659 [Perkinsus marinus ATCC 50983]EER16196.1 hypothetical protein Pmar_PMAR003659 [Perkinsus marinus ATCC 50983]|eukprot:XP_002784400.1 hypothetical protein Pmar_PMAR003659 [Perkinsus marinus ATCC 50983]